MIVSHSRQFIFVKCRKTASTSLEREIVPQLTCRDIWTPISSPKRQGHNHHSAWPIDWLSAKSQWFSDLIGRDSPLHWRFFHDHIAAAHIARLLPRDIYRSYYKFCFDRNPWDFAVSLFHQKTTKRRFRHDFDRFLHEFPIQPNWQLYTENDQIIVDRVFRYEEINSAVAEIATRLSLKLNLRAEDKGSYRKNKDYRSFYSQSSRDYVAERWKQPIAFLGYEF